MNQLQQKAYKLRQDVVDMIRNGKGGHIGGDMSVMEIMVALYDHMNVTPENINSDDHDHFVLSKGHCVETLYAVLADKGFLDLQDILDTFGKFESKYIGHPYNKLNGIEMNSGSLGHGLSVSVGMALAGKMDHKSYRVYTVMGDGELAEGSVWEGAMAAGNYQLDNLCAIIDRNGLQISGSTEDVMKQGDVGKRFETFGWNVIDVQDGNDVTQIQEALKQAEEVKGKPTLIVAHTVKGKGSSVMENKASWHHKVPTEEEYVQICADFKKHMEELEHE